MIRLGLVTVAAACGTPPAQHPGSASAQLSLAADAQMIAIPGGKFVAGSTPEERTAAYDDYMATAGKDTARDSKWFETEEDRHLANAAPFRIDLMPVTQGQYAEFVLAGGAPAPTMDAATWQAQGFTQDFATQVARFAWTEGAPPPTRVEHPVVLVSWTDADKYCRWRGEQRGEPRRLPSALEYEKAVRGDGGLIYPWGNAYEPDKLDSAVKGPGDTVPVGQYIQGASPYGVLDLAGNVYEWTSTPFGDGKMTVKGSAWEDFGGVGRGASRHGRAREVRHVIVGFRCAAATPE
jgi:formylglycine-generating enzyme required for sulfatase activity